jgi:biopolymer transport protein ExbD
MLNVRKSMRDNSPRPEVNMGPLIDMVFLLLIFFVVTTNFVKEAGVEVERVTTPGASVKERGNIMVGVTTAGDVFYEGRRVDVRSVRALVERALIEDPDSHVVVVADRSSMTGVVVRVVDQCRLAGAAHVALAARRGNLED